MDSSLYHLLVSELLNMLLTVATIIALALIATGVLYLYLFKNWDNTVDEDRIRHTNWIKNMDSDDAKELLIHALESDMDVYEYIATVNDESTADANAIRDNLEKKSL